MKNRKNFLVYTIFAVVLISAISFYSCKKDNGNDAGVIMTGTPAENEVWIEDMGFNPTTRTVPLNTEIVWRNVDNKDHTVTSGSPGNPTGLFDENVIPQGRFAFTFDSSGTYQYYDRKDTSDLQGTIVVQ